MENSERYLTVTALTKYISYKFSHDRNLENVLLEGEVSNFKHNSRGHFYFTLKDENAEIMAMMFASNAQKVKIIPEDGMKVFVRGRVTVYEKAGTYQIVCSELKTSGIGDLYLAYEKLKRELEAKGLFDPAHKKPIPKFPKIVGVITSPTGAAIRDIINTISRRYPICQVVLYPAIVQGDEAKNDIVAQIKKANLDGLCDTLIVGRGGGSIEDLWAFNEEIVARAIYDSNIPIISAVGHEIDFTIADFVSDIRAATPTAAAEIATPSKESIKEYLNNYNSFMTKKVLTIIDTNKERLANIDKRIDFARPDKKLETNKKELDNIVKNINYNISQIISNYKHQLEIFNKTIVSYNPINKVEEYKTQIKNYQKSYNYLINMILNDKKGEFNILRASLENLNPLKIMDKGYSISSVNNKIIKDVKNVKVGDTLETKMKNGKIISTVSEVIKDGE